MAKGKGLGGGGISAQSSLLPAASFYKTSNLHSPGSQTQVLLTLPHPDHHPPPPATPGREGTAGEEGWPMEGVAHPGRPGGGGDGGDYVDRKGLRLRPERGHDDG